MASTNEAKTEEKFKGYLSVTASIKKIRARNHSQQAQGNPRTYGQVTYNVEEQEQRRITTGPALAVLARRRDSVQV